MKNSEQKRYFSSDEIRKLIQLDIDKETNRLKNEEILTTAFYSTKKMADDGIVYKFYWRFGLPVSLNCEKYEVMIDPQHAIPVVEYIRPTLRLGDSTTDEFCMDCPFVKCMFNEWEPSKSYHRCELYDVKLEEETDVKISRCEFCKQDRKY